MKKSEKEQLDKLLEGLEAGTLADQPCWSFIRDLNSFSSERLDSIAIRDGYRTYSYRQMFRYWEKYAEAFSAVNITGKNRSRVGLVGAQVTESTFAFYGLNMTGAAVSLIYPLDLFDEKQIYPMIEREKITDLVISEVFAFPLLMKRLLRDRELLGLRNIIVIGSDMGGEYAIPPLEMVCNLNRDLYRELDGALLMEDLMEEHEAAPISYGKAKSSEASVILHTTGTVSGMHKPVPMSDKALNAFVACAVKIKDTYDDFKNLPKHLVTCMQLNMSWVYGMVDMLHTSLGLGMEVVCLPFGGINPGYSSAIEEYGINVMFTSKSILDSWLKTMPEMDLSKVKVVFMGGTYISPEFKENFNKYLRSCGSTARVINGYGLSELGGACALSPSTREDDAIGFLLPGFKAKILVEDEGVYYDIEDGPRTGVLCLTSPTISSGKLGNTVFFELERIGDEDYFNTNDLVRVNEDGSLTCIGRSNQFFVNNAGVRFDAGLVENAITAQPGIVACGLAPEFHKPIHDNIPVLYVETSEHGAADLSIVRKALIEVFLTDGMLVDTNMPSQVVLTDRVPLNASGKVDAKQLASGSVTGRRYSVKPVKLDGKLVDIVMIPAAEGELATMGAGIPEELEGDPYTILSEVFAAIPDLTKGNYSKLFRIPGLREMVLKLSGFDIQNVPRSMLSFTPKMCSMAFRKFLLPLMKGENKMSKKKSFKKKDFAGFMPMFPGMMPPVPPMPPMPFAPDFDNWDWFGTKNSETTEKMEENFFSFWDHFIDMQKSSMDNAKEQWDQFFANVKEMQENFVDSLPDELPNLPGMSAGKKQALSPKAIMKNLQEYQEIAGEHLKAQADTVNDFIIQGQEKTRDVVKETKDIIDEAVEEKSADDQQDE